MLLIVIQLEVVDLISTWLQSNQIEVAMLARHGWKQSMLVLVTSVLPDKKS